jgi:hypothetical protein
MEGVVGALASFIGYNSNNSNNSDSYGRGDSSYNSQTPESWKILEDDCAVCGIVLSLWDNISGPRIEQVFLRHKT